MIEISDVDKILMDAVQQDFPLTLRPFQTIGENCGLSETEVIDRIERLTSSGVIREISAILDA